jgi:hypothetical protein
MYYARPKKSPAVYQYPGPAIDDAPGTTPRLAGNPAPFFYPSARPPLPIERGSRSSLQAGAGTVEECDGRGGANAGESESTGKRAGPAGIGTVTAELVEKVFGLGCVVVPDPVSGTPMVVPAED